MNEFIPKLIGVPESETYNKIHDLYADLVDHIVYLQMDMESLFEEANITIDDIIDLIQKSPADLDLHLRTKYVNVNQIAIPGINKDKLIKSDMLDLPESYSEIIKHHKAINVLIDQITLTYFYIPLSSLFQPGQKHDEFLLSDEFVNKLKLFTTTYTENEEQNIALEAVQKWCDATNDLIELGIVKTLGSSWTQVGDILGKGVQVDRNNKRPLYPGSKIFNNYHALGKFGKAKQFVPRQRDRNAIMC